jgi:hypothetical protein
MFGRREIPIAEEEKLSQITINLQSVFDEVGQALTIMSCGRGLCPNSLQATAAQIFQNRGPMGVQFIEFSQRH